MSLKHLLLGMGFLASSVAFAQPLEIDAPVDKIFIPQGFDDNDNVEVVAHGDFMNGCYRVGKSDSFVDEDAKRITIEVSAYRYQHEKDQDAVCMQVMTPFIQKVKVGVLKAGTYTVSVKGAGEAVEETLTIVRRKTEDPDDFLYAPVENAYLKVDDRGKQSLLLQGTYPHWLVGCQKIKEVRVNRNPSDVMVVLPITEVSEDNCQDYSFNFSHRVNLPEPFMQEGLLHVRVMNGASTNTYLPGYF